jgi:hypothetical protein
LYSPLSYTGTKPLWGVSNYRGNTQRGRGNLPSTKGGTCHYSLKLNHFAKDCRDTIDKGHDIPVADIEKGLYNEGYFGETRQEEVDSTHHSYLSIK